jgi:hypothetical protein
MSLFLKCIKKNLKTSSNISRSNARGIHLVLLMWHPTCKVFFYDVARSILAHLYLTSNTIFKFIKNINVIVFLYYTQTLQSCN